MVTRLFATCAAIAMVCPLAGADDAKDRLTEFLKATPGADAGRVSALTDGAATFPDHTLYAFVFPQFPVSREAPAPFKSANVIAIPNKKDAKPVVITTTQEVEDFFKASARAVKTDAEAEAAVKFWVRAQAELNQDGFFRFAVKAEAAKLDGAVTTITAVAIADQKNGDSGEVKATTKFKDGKLSAATTTSSLKAGMRPRCQATKLLDSDPIVRGMAEDAIRFMGRSAKPYLDEQRAKASPKLREAIDRMWRIIEEEDR